jgi:branched-chain amino acid transport system ATP-binding protein
MTANQHEMDLPARPEGAGRDGIIATAVSRSFGQVHAVEHMDFHAPAGKVTALIGPNGAGKTSLFNVLTRVYQPGGGSIQFAGRDLLSLKTDQLAAAGVARTFQNLGLFPLMTVLENLLTYRHHLMKSGVMAGGIRFGLSSREEKLHRQRCLEIADFLGLGPWLHRITRDLPYGIQKKIELARALAMEPKLLLLDEPVAGMNQEETQEIAEDIITIQRDMGIAQILVEHDMGMVMGIADRIMVLDFGQRIALGSPEEVQAHPDVVRAYLGQDT